MKIALCCDSLLERDDSTEILDLFCEIFPEAPIYTFAHGQGKILGHVELRKITSSYLSRMVNSRQSFDRWKFLIPTLGRSFQVFADVDLLVSLSTGFSHGITLPPQTKHISYLYSIDERSSHFVTKIFSAYCQKWQRRSLANADYLLMSSQHLQERLQPALHEKKSKVIPPVFNFKDFPLGFPKNQQGLDFNYYVANLEGTPWQVVEKVSHLFHELHIPLKWVGEDQELCRKVLRRNNYLLGSQIEFWGKRCHGDLSLLLQSARAALDFSLPAFPHFSLAALSSGRPFIVTRHPINHEFLPREGGFFWDNQGGDQAGYSLKDLILKMNNEFTWFEPLSLRKYALKFQDMAFRKELKKVVEEIFNEKV